MGAPKERAVIFGAGLAGQRACRLLRHRSRVLAFVDNDAGKHGTRVLRRPVIGPSDLPGLRVDRVYIASMHAQEIATQLWNERVIDPARVEIVPTAVTRGDYEVSRWTYVALGVLVFGGVAMLAGIGVFVRLIG